MVKNTPLILFLIVLTLGIAGIMLFPYQTVNPGVLINSHLYLKNDCLSCHILGSGAHPDKCIDCHELSVIGLMFVNGDKRTEVNTKSNLLHQSIVNINCFDCHTEHNGLSRENATLKFKHNVLSADLQMQCLKCHLPQKPEDDIHALINSVCSDCHSDIAWKPSTFKHELLGERKNNCRYCHLNRRPDDALHISLSRSVQCISCHTTEKWKPSTFDHTKYFRFDRNHPSDCVSCHNDSKTFVIYTCYNCHEHRPVRIAEKHMKEGIRNFNNCVECHRSGNEKEARRLHRKQLELDPG